MQTTKVADRGLEFMLAPFREEWKQIEQAYRVQGLSGKEELEVAHKEVSNFLGRVVGALTEDRILAKKKKVVQFIEKIDALLFLIERKKFSNKIQRNEVDDAVADFTRRYEILRTNLDRSDLIEFRDVICTEAEFLSDACMKRFFRAQSLRLVQAESFLNLSNDFAELSRC